MLKYTLLYSKNHGELHITGDGDELEAFMEKILDPMNKIFPNDKYAESSDGEIIVWSGESI